MNTRANTSYVNNNGVLVNVRGIPKEGKSREVPTRGQNTHVPSFRAHLLYQSHPNKIQKRRNNAKTHKREKVRELYGEIQSARRNNNTKKRGPKGAKGR